MHELVLFCLLFRSDRHGFQTGWDMGLAAGSSFFYPSPHAVVDADLTTAVLPDRFPLCLTPTCVYCMQPVLPTFFFLLVVGCIYLVIYPIVYLLLPTVDWTLFLFLFHSNVPLPPCLTLLLTPGGGLFYCHSIFLQVCWTTDRWTGLIYLLLLDWQFDGHYPHVLPAFIATYRLTYKLILPLPVLLFITTHIVLVGLGWIPNCTPYPFYCQLFVL